MQNAAYYSRPAWWRRRNFTKTLLVMTPNEVRSHGADGKSIMLAMKLTMVFLTAVFLQVQSAGLSQSITLSGKNVEIKQIFAAIEKQTGYVFFYNKGVLAGSRPVSLTVTNMPLADFLELSLKDQPFTYLIADKTISLSRKPTPSPPAADPALNPAPSDRQLPTPVTGVITGSDGKPLSGASVAVKNSKNSTATNAAGVFTLNVNHGDILVISHIGYAPKEFKISSSNLSGGKIPFSITLEISNSPLDEVQIIGYGQTTRRLNTGNVYKVTAEEIEKQPIANFLQALEGRVPGLLITQQSGVPGSNFTVQIRGQNSILNGNTPLYIVDGIPYSSDNLNQVLSGYTGTGYATAPGSAAGLGGLSPLNNINPADLESIEILKDADATAIYGSRGANGVILITTKKGMIGPLAVSANVNYGTNVPTRLMKFMNTQQYLEMRKEAFTNDKTTPNPSNDYDLLSWDQNKYTDWTKALVTNLSSTQNAQLSVSGGTIQTRYQLGLDYSRQNPPYGGNFSDNRGTVRFNINNTSLNRKFTMGFSSSYSLDYNNLPGMDQYANVNLAPNAPDMFNADGSLKWTNYVSNPYASLLRPYKATTKNLMANVQLGYKIIDGLNIKASLGYTNTQFNEVRNNPASSFLPTTYNLTQANSTWGNNGGDTWIFEPQAEYTRRLLGGKIDVLVGSTMQGNISQGQIISGVFKTDAFLNNINAAITKTISNSYSKYDYAAVFGRFGYNFDNKYVLNLTGRRDGSSRFGPDRQMANFGAVGAAWIFSEERIIKYGLPFLSFGKFRTSYGITGSDQIANYRYLESYTPNSAFSYQGLNGLTPTRLTNPDFSWESNKKLEAAAELGFAKDRITLSASWFRNRSSNQLVDVPLSPATGNVSVQANLPATVQNTGWEFMLNSTNVHAKDFTWKTAFTMTISRNKLVSFPNLDKSSYSNTYIVGQPVTILKLFKFAGVNPTTGMYQFVNKKGVTTSTPTYGVDNYVVFNPNPNFYGGIQNSLTYKGISLDIFVQYQKQKGRNLVAGWPNMIGSANNLPLIFLDRWQKPGDVKPIQKYTEMYGATATAGVAASNSDQGWSDASFVRIKNVAISYVLNPKRMKKLFIKSAKVYAQAQNLFTFSSYLGADPETQGLVLPPMKTVSGGVQLTF
jgi:TonB-linked SusC/RagA family outer membrane protein